MHGVCHEAGGEERGPARLSLRLRGGQDEGRGGQQAAHPAGEDRTARGGSGRRERDGDVPPREDLRPPDRVRDGLLGRPATERAVSSDGAAPRVLPGAGRRAAPPGSGAGGEHQRRRAALRGCREGRGRRDGPWRDPEEREPRGAGGGAPRAGRAAPADPRRHVRERRADRRPGAEVPGPSGGPCGGSGRPGRAHRHAGRDGREGPRAGAAGRESGRRAPVQHRDPQDGAEGESRAAGLPDPECRHCPGSAVPGGRRVHAAAEVRVDPGPRHASSTRRSCR